MTLKIFRLIKIYLIVTLFCLWPSIIVFASPPTPEQTNDAGFIAKQKAVKEGKYLMIFFYKPTQGDNLISDANTLANKFADKLNIININLDDPNEKFLVDTYRAQKAPMPLILLVAPNGAVTGSFLKTIPEEDKFKSSLFGPGMQKCVSALQKGKLLFVCLQSKTTKENEAALSGVQQIAKDSKFGIFTEIVMVDPTDPNETQLLKRFNINAKITTAETIFLMPPGRIAGKWIGATSKDTIINRIMAMSRSCGDPKCKDPKCPPSPNSKNKGGK